MITEVGQERPGQEEKDPTAGKGQPRSEGEGVARPAPDAGGAAAQQGSGTSAEAGGDGGAGDAGTNAAVAADAPADDPEPADQLAEIAESVALAEVMKPVATATEDLYSTAPDKVKARRAIVDDYAKALSTPPGDLLAKYEAADKRFVRTAQDMAEALEGWIERLLTDAGGTSAVARALGERAQVRARLAALTGGREGARLLAQAETKWWADRFADWSAPGARMSALVADYAGKIEKLNADINNDINADLAIFSFWFEIAPRHLQLRNEPLDDDVIEKQIDDLKAALGPDSDLAAQFEIGSARADGSLYLIPADALEQRRRDVLADWKGAAERQAFRSAIETLERIIPGARPVPPELWELLQGAPDYQPTWWAYRAKETTIRAWLMADVGHPFAKLGDVDSSDATKAAAALQAFVAREPDPAPLILSALIAAQLACGQTPSRGHILAVLAAEAWLGGEMILRARWARKIQGMAAWSVALKAALAQGDFLSSTPFAPLAGHPEAYSGTDEEGPALLEEVAQGFRDRGDHAAEVRQRRNAAFLSLYTRGGYAQKQIQEIGDACERVQPASLAVTLARAYGEVTLRDA